MKNSDTITFYEWLTPFVASGQKTITIRDESENSYIPGSRVAVYVMESNAYICDIVIDSVKPLDYNDINEEHARQEHMDLPRLKRVIRDIYPDTDRLFVISFHLASC